MNTFSGTGVALVTPFQADGAVDTAALTRLVEHLIKGNVSYLVVLGTTGEAATLDAGEQQLVIETILDSNAGRLPVVLGVGGNNTKAIADKAHDWSERYQPAGLLSVSPYYNKPTQEGIFQHYAAIAGQTDLPIILYNVPGRTSSHVRAETTLKLAQAFPHIVATKEASGNFAEIMTIIRDAPEGFQVISGDDYLTLPLLSLGASGIISVIGNALPGPFSEMVRLALAGHFDQARNLHCDMLELMKLVFREGNPAGVKSLMALDNLMRPEVRLPLLKASNGLSVALETALGRFKHRYRLES